MERRHAACPSQEALGPVRTMQYRRHRTVTKTDLGTFTKSVFPHGDHTAFAIAGLSSSNLLRRASNRLV
jgi:hypothetical protein